MMNTLRVAVDVGGRFHQVAFGNGGGQLLDEFQIDHGLTGFERFFAASAGTRPRMFARRWRVTTVGHDHWTSRSWHRAGVCNVHKLKLARYKEIVPAPAKSDAIDTRRMLEWFAFDEQCPLGRDVLQEMTVPTTTQRELKYLTRRRRQQVADRTTGLARLQGDLLAVCPDLLALT